MYIPIGTWRVEGGGFAVGIPRCLVDLGLGFRP